MTIPVQDWVAHGAALYPEKLAMVDLDSDRHITYRQFANRTGYLAGFLTRSLGLAKGDRIAILCKNTTDVFELLFACLRTGVILVPLNWRLAGAELAYILQDSNPKVLFFDPDFEATASHASQAASIPALLTVAYGDESDYEQGIAQKHNAPTPVDQNSDDPWLLLYTSGTTGRPKGVILDYKMMLFNAINVCPPLKITSDSRGVTFLPTFHIGGFNSYALPLFFVGGTTYIPRTFNARQFFDLHASREIGITHSGGVPTQLQMMREQPGFTGADLNHIKVMAVGGAAVPRSLIEAYHNKGVRLNNAWGMTETAGMVTILRSENATTHPGSCGQKVLFSDLRIITRDGQDAEGQEIGEIYIKGPTITRGYWQNSKATCDAFDNGWLKTGDAASKDEDGYYTIVDRWKDMFISGGENIYPAEIEDAICRLDSVSSAAVIGISHNKWGEVGRAFVLAKPGHNNVTPELIREHCEAQLARYKIPADIRIVESLPTNASGKIMKHLLPRD